jgi:hypothetical protein
MYNNYMLDNEQERKNLTNEFEQKKTIYTIQLARLANRIKRLASLEETK